MSVKKTVETTSSKILNSDIYDITRFVDDIKKKNIDGVEDKETLLVGMYGYLGYQFSSLLQNAIVTASELSNEAIPTRAKFDRNVITHALSLGVKKVAATPANMKVLLMFPEKALRANMIDGKFTLKAKTPLQFDEYEFHTDYDITINYADLTDSTNGSKRNYVYTASYNMDVKNPISDLDNPFLPPVAIFNYTADNMVALSTNLHQVYYQEIYEKILTSDVIANKTISFSFERQMSHFMVKVKEPASSNGDEGKEVTLHPVYDGLYNQEIANQKYCYYQYINSNTIRIRFDPSNYQPPANSDLTIELYTTSGSEGNFEYSEEKTIRLTSDEYTNLYCIVAQRGDDGSSGGLDRQTIDQLQHIIPKEALSRGSITTLTDLRNFFNSLNNENSVLHVFRKEDNILDRVYYVYNLMKDAELNVVPTNTIPIYLESTRRDNHNGNIYLESGTPIFYYKFGEGADVPLLHKNYIGYLDQKVANVETNYSFYNGNGLTTFQGTPDNDSLAIWWKEYRKSFDHEKVVNDFKYKVQKPSNSYDFHYNGSIYFKPYYSDNIKITLSNVKNNDDIKNACSNWFYGTCRDCELAKTSLAIHTIVSKMTEMLNNNLPVDFEIEWEDGSIVTHYPMRNQDSIDPVERGYIKDNFDGSKYNLYIEPKFIEKIKSVRFFRPRQFDSIGEVVSLSDKCEFELYIDEENRVPYSLNVNIYAWLTRLSFYDDTCKFRLNYYSDIPAPVNRTFFVPDYIVNLDGLDIDNRKLYAEQYLNLLMRPYMDGSDSLLVLEAINTIDTYSYDGQGSYGFDSLRLSEGDLIRFSTYLEGENKDEFVYLNPTTWTLGEVLSIEKNDGRIISIEVLVKNEELGQFENYRYRLPVPITDTFSKDYVLDENCITVLSKLSKSPQNPTFLYTTPLSIILKDDPTINTHRVTASYYLDIIDETRYQQFDCINSKSPIQFILPSIKTYRSSYLSDNRYKYTIKINIKPNTGTVDINMINRTQVIGVFYKKGTDETSVARPIMYSIAEYVGGEDLNGIIDGAIPYEITLYTRPFETSTTDDYERNDYGIINDEGQVYMGTRQLMKEIEAEFGNLDSEEAKQAFFDRYKVYLADANFERPLNCPNELDLKSISDYKYAETVYLNINTELKIYILYKYDILNTKMYTDGLANEFLAVNMANADALYNTVSQKTNFKGPIPVDDESSFNQEYTLKSMVLTNVYSTYQGINILHDYSNIMNSYVTSIRTNDIFNPDNNTIESYIVNRVPCVRYFYWNTEERVLTFINEMKKKINYVLDAIAPLECTFGLDYKFFNTYGPSKMYHLTDDDGDIISEQDGGLINNVALTMTFRAKFYNEDADALSIVDKIKDSIKEYLEKLDSLDDIHFPNVTTMIETEYAEYLIYFEFVSFNIYDATTQHVITVEDMEMLSMVPEFLHVDTNDWNGKPYINVRIVT